MFDGISIACSCEVFRNTVQWRKEFVFECGATVNGSTGVLSNSICRVSVREVRRCLSKYPFVSVFEREGVHVCVS